MSIIKDLSNSFNPVPKPNKKETKKKTEIKKKSSKLAKLERERDKDKIKSGICQCCGRYSKRLDPHEIFGGCNRQISMKNNFVKLICRECHSNPKIIKQLKINTQKEFEKTRTREEFINIIGKSQIREE